MKKLITVALLTYNRDNLLRYSIEAILKQTYKDFEFLIVDNGSTDDTSNIVASYNDQRIKCIKLPVGGTPSDSFFNAILLSTGDYLLITHDDDILEKDFLQIYMDKFDTSDIVAITSNVSLIDLNNKVIQDKLYNINKDMIFNKQEYIKKYLSDKLWLPMPTLCVKRSIYQEIYKYELENKIFKNNPSEDIWQVTMINTFGKIVLLEKPLLKYRQHINQESRNVDQSKPMIDLSKSLLKTKRITNSNKQQIPDMLGLYLKYKLQDILFTNPNYLHKINLLIHLYNRNELYMCNKLTNVILFEIFITQHYQQRIDKRIDKIFDNKLLSSYNNWLYLIKHKTSILKSIEPNKNIIIFGSMITAYLIVKEAFDYNYNVKYCVDSSPQRIGNKVFNIDIIDLEELKHTNIHNWIIILSNEREHNEAIKKLIYDKLESDSIKIISWRELVKESLTTIE